MPLCMWVAVQQKQEGAHSHYNEAKRMLQDVEKFCVSPTIVYDGLYNVCAH